MEIAGPVVDPDVGRVVIGIFIALIVTPPIAYTIRRVISDQRQRKKRSPRD